jgi:hypothetical protein
MRRWVGATLVVCSLGCVDRGIGSEDGDDTGVADPTTSTTAADDDDPSDPTLAPTVDPDTTDTGPLEDHCTPDGSIPTLEVGHGSSGFAPFSTGPASLVYGDQGGIHIDVGMRAEYLDVSGVFISEVRGYLGGEEVAVGQGGTILACRPDQQALERAGIRLVFDLSPTQVHMQTITVEASFQDTQSTTVMASGEVLVVDPTMR